MQENALILHLRPEPECLLLSSNTHSSLSLFLFSGCVGIFLSVLPLPSRIAHLMQLPQENLSKVKSGEADSNCNGSFDPVHAETFVESTNHAFLRHDLPHGAQDGAVCVTRDSCSLHAASHHVQRVRSRLADETRTGSKCQTFIRVGLWAPTALYTGEEGVKTCQSVNK